MAANLGCLLVLILQLHLGLQLCLSAGVTEHGGFGRAAEGALFVFGDSYVDTGNHDPNRTDPVLGITWRAPYGDLWPGHPSGRASDGRVLTDFFAPFLGMKQPILYRLFNRTKRGDKHRHPRRRPRGINFAFGGSGVFPTFGPQFPNVSTQIGQLTELIQKGLVSKKLVRRSTVLFVLAGNDYLAYQMQHPELQGVEEFIPKVVAEVALSLKALQDVGFRRVVATGMETVGCLPYFTSPDSYTSCDLSVNQLASLHNSLLASRVASLQASHAAATSSLSMLDLFSAFETVLSSPRFSLRPCCAGIGNGTGCGDVNSDGRRLYSLCSFPYETLFWDSVHPTDAGWTAITKVLFASIP